jgi:hypothetical protein
LALGYGGEEASESGSEIAGGHEAAGKVIGDVLAGGFASKGLGVLAAWNAQRYGCSARGVRQWRPSAKVNEHKEARTLERLVDMEVSRRKIRFWIFGGASPEARRSS